MHVRESVSFLSPAVRNAMQRLLSSASDSYLQKYPKADKLSLLASLPLPSKESFRSFLGSRTSFQERAKVFM